MRNAILECIVGLVILMLIVVVQSPAFGSAIQKGNRAVAETTHNPPPPQATVVEGKIAVAPAHEPEEHFRKARESFVGNNVKAAAAQIRKGAAFLKHEAGNGTGDVKEALAASRQELERLAQRVENGTITSTQELRRAFARADLVLAKQHFQEAVESWSKKEIHETGHELKAAANDCGLTLAWAGRGLEGAAASTLKDARVVAAKLNADAAWTAGEVGKGLDAMGKEIEKLGTQI